MSYHPESWRTARLILDIGCSSLQILPSSSSCWWLPVIASSPNTRFSQWVMAVPRSPWSSSSPPSSVGHLKCLRTSLRTLGVTSKCAVLFTFYTRGKVRMSCGKKTTPEPLPPPTPPSPPSSLCWSQPDRGNTFEEFLAGKNIFRIFTLAV